MTLLEQQGKNFTNGSSYGVARIARSLGPKNDVFSYVHNRTVKEVKQLNDFLNKKGKGKKHKMEDIYSTSPVSYLYTRDQYDQINKLRYKKQRKDYRRASGDAAFRKFGVTLKTDEVMVREFREHSGTLNPHELIQKLRLAIGLKGGKISFNQKVTRLTKTGDTFEVEVLNLKTNKKKTIQTKKVVLAAGPYTVEVLKEFAPYFNRVITPKRVLVTYFKIAEDRYKELSEKELNSIVAAQPMFSQIGYEYFSMIEKWEDGQPIFKAGLHKMRHNVVDVDKAWNLEPRKKEIKWLKKKFRKYFDMLEIYLKKKDIELTRHCNCLYSVTLSLIHI